MRNKVTHDHRNVKYNDIQHFINNLQENLQNPAQIKNTALFNKLVSSATRDSKGVYDAKLVQFMSTNQSQSRSIHEAALNYWYAKQLVEISSHIPKGNKDFTKEDVYYAVMYWELLTQISNSSPGRTFLEKLRIPPVNSTGRNNVLHSLGTRGSLQNKEIVDANLHIQLYIKALETHCNTVESEKNGTILNCEKQAIQRFDKNRSRLYPTPSINFDPPNLSSSSKDTRAFREEKSRHFERKYNKNPEERPKKTINIQHEIENNSDLIKIRTQILNQDFSKRKSGEKELEFEKLWNKLPNHLKNEKTIESLKGFIRKIYKDNNETSSRNTLLNNWKIKLKKNLQSSSSKDQFLEEKTVSATEKTDINRQLLSMYRNDLINYSNMIKEFYKTYSAWNTSNGIDEKEALSEPKINEKMNPAEIAEALAVYKAAVIKYKESFLNAIEEKNSHQLRIELEEVISEIQTPQIPPLLTVNSFDLSVAGSTSISLLGEDDETTEINKTLLGMRMTDLIKYNDAIERLYKKYSSEEEKKIINYRPPPDNLQIIKSMSVEEINKKIEEYYEHIKNYKKNFLQDIEIINDQKTKNSLRSVVIHLVPEKIGLIQLPKEKEMNQPQKRKREEVSEQQAKLEELKEELRRRNKDLDSIGKSHADYKKLENEFNKLLDNYQERKKTLTPSQGSLESSSYTQSVRVAGGSPLYQQQGSSTKQSTKEEAPTPGQLLKKGNK